MSLPERPDKTHEVGVPAATSVDLIRGSGAIAVNSQGEAFTDLTRAKETVIKSERLDSLNPVVKIDLEKIITEQRGAGVSIVVQDFGLPPRVINVRGEFTDVSDVEGMKREDEHYRNAPKHLTLEVISPETNGTYCFDEKGLPSNDGTEVVLSRGQAMLWAHDGAPSDVRTGYIEGSMWELVAQDTYYGKPDFSDLDETGGHLRPGFVPLVGMSYEGNILSVYSLDDVHAEVKFQQVRSLDEEIADTEAAEFEGVDIKELLLGFVKSETITTIIEERASLLDRLQEANAQLAEALLAQDNMETLLAVNKGKLRDARHEIASLLGKVRKLESESNTKATQGSSSIHDILGGKQATEADPHGYCSQLGLSPEFLFGLDAQTAAKVVKGVHKGLVTGFHPDLNKDPNASEAMKTINNAVDGVLERIEQGHWGRR